MLAFIRELLAVIREALVIVVVAVVLLYPSHVGKWLYDRGVQKIGVAGVEISMAQFAETREVLNTVTQAASALDGQPELQASLRQVATQIGHSMANQVRVLQQRDPAALPQGGWVYLGTLDAARTRWLHGSYIREAWPLKPGDTATVDTDLNLRGDSASEQRPQASIKSVLPDGTKVRIQELDTSRPVAPGSGEPPGFRVWARVDVVGRAS